MTESVFKCELCEEQCDDRKLLNVHRQTIHKIKYGSDQCERNYPNPKSLRYHINLVHGGRQYRCQKCDDRFFSKEHLSNPKRLCTEPITRFNCEVKKGNILPPILITFQSKKRKSMRLINIVVTYVVKQPIIKKKELRYNIRSIHKLKVENETTTTKCGQGGKKCYNTARYTRFIHV